MDPLNVLTGEFTLKSRKPCDLSSCTKEEILEYFENSYSINESLFTILASKEAFYMCPDRLRLPLVFYYAHTAVVYWNKMLLAGLVKERMHPEFEMLFETGVDEQSWDDTENYRMGGSFKWPPLEEVVEYRLKVRNVIRKIIADSELTLPITMESPWWAFFMGFEHERIHIDTSSVLIRQLPIHLVRRPKDWSPGPILHGKGAAENKMVTVAMCDVAMGKPMDFPSYGWDNEYPQYNVKVPSFEASQFLITNKDFLAFVESGCYRKKQYWTEEGWKWRNFREVVHPIFWVCSQGCLSNCGGVLAGYSHCKPLTNGKTNGVNGSANGHSNGHSNGNGVTDTQTSEFRFNNNYNDKYRLRVTCEEIDMAWDWPVCVNYHEAKAYCNWKGPGYRVMSEAEHLAIRDKQLDSCKGTSEDIVFQDDLHKRYNTNLAYCTSTPVNLYPANQKGFYDVFGNVWEWMEDHFNGLQGNTTHHLYDDFSTPTYDGRHNVIKGGCWVSTGDESSHFARYAFRRHFYQHVGFRLVRLLDKDQILPVTLMTLNNGANPDISLPEGTQTGPPVPSTNLQLSHESAEHLRAQLLQEYHFGKGNLYSQLAEVCRHAIQDQGTNGLSALDLHCGCGRLSFELTNFMKEVLGIDYCESFLNVANQMKEDGRYLATLPNGKTHTIEMPEGTARSGVHFKQFTWVPNEISNFDLVVLQGIDRVMNKKAWLLRLWEIIVPDGVVVIVSTQGCDAEQLKPHIAKRMKLVEEKQLSYAEPSGDVATATVTIWHRH